MVEYTKDDIYQQVKDQIDIVDLVSEYVSLQKKKVRTITSVFVLFITRKLLRSAFRRPSRYIIASVATKAAIV